MMPPDTPRTYLFVYITYLYYELVCLFVYINYII